MIALSRVSWSRIETLSSCGKKFQLRYLEGVKGEPSGPLIAGSTIHDVVKACEERVLAGETSFGDPEIDAAIGGAFRDLFAQRVFEAGGQDAIRWAGRKSLEFPSGEDFKWWVKMGPIMLRRYHAVRTFDINDGARLYDNAIERGITTQLDDGSYLSAVFDAVLLVDHDGTLKVRDLKSGRVGGSQPLQLALYAWLIHRALDVIPQFGEFIYLRTGSSSMIQTYDLTPLMEIVPELIRGYSQTLEGGVFIMSPGPFCKNCEVRKLCSYGVTLP